MINYIVLYLRRDRLGNIFFMEKEYEELKKELKLRKSKAEEYILIIKFKKSFIHFREEDESYIYILDFKPEEMREIFKEE